MADRRKALLLREYTAACSQACPQALPQAAGTVWVRPAAGAPRPLYTPWVQPLRLQKLQCRNTFLSRQKFNNKCL